MIQYVGCFAATKPMVRNPIYLHNPTYIYSYLMLSTCLIYIYIIYIYNTYIYYLSGGVEHVFQSVTTSPPFQTAEVFAVVQAACGEEKIVSVKVNG